jgi:hypothetical protein
MARHALVTSSLLLYESIKHLMQKKKKKRPGVGAKGESKSDNSETFLLVLAMNRVKRHVSLDTSQEAQYVRSAGCAHLCEHSLQAEKPSR